MSVKHTLGGWVCKCCGISLGKGPTPNHHVCAFDDTNQSCLKDAELSALRKEVERLRNALAVACEVALVRAALAPGVGGGGRGKKGNMPKVLNRHCYADRVPRGVVYVGRGTKWGNPFKIGPNHTREQTVELYRHYGVQRGLDELAHKELRGKDLACWCVPLPCHADVLLEWANGKVLEGDADDKG